MQAELIVLGCGDSAGTPRIGNAWGKCDPQEPKNIRTRAAICVRSGTTTVIVDTGPDFKQQINREDIKSIDAVLYTHAHSDHVNGMDDLKPFHDRARKRVPIYVMPTTLSEMRFRFNYLFEQKSPLYPPIVEPKVWDDGDYGVSHRVGDISFIPFLQDHGLENSVGFRFGDVGYSTDLIDIDDKGLSVLEGISTWIVDGANLHIENPMVHPNLLRIRAMNERIGAKTIYLTHMKFDLDYQTLVKTLPDGVFPCHDGLKIGVRY